MTTPTPTLTKWPSAAPPARADLEAQFRTLGLSPSWWSNGPGDRYAPHAHPYHKVLFCAQGSIRFTISPSSETFDLAPGDRLDIPPGVTHSAVVGGHGVTCVEAARR
jgi:mannose-6-phosphate isomerase-like protein (cupin superfamily)